MNAKCSNCSRESVLLCKVCNQPYCCIRCLKTHAVDKADHDKLPEYVLLSPIEQPKI